MFGSRSLRWTVISLLMGVFTGRNWVRHRDKCCVRSDHLSRALQSLKCVGSGIYVSFKNVRGLSHYTYTGTGPGIFCTPYFWPRSRSRSVQMCHDAKCSGHISHLCPLHTHSSRAAKSPVHKLATKMFCCQV